MRREGEAPSEPFAARRDREGEAPPEPFAARRDREGEAPPEPFATGSRGGTPRVRIDLPAATLSSVAMEPGAFDDLPQRRRPAKGVRIQPLGATIVFVTVCTKNRDPWLACPAVHELLVDVWRNATAWVVGRYMPDHIHLFCAPGTPELPLENWIRYWKSRFSNRHLNPAHVWHPDAWDTRLRSGMSYAEKWEYVHNNPVRKGLVATADEWPFQGELNHLKW